MSTEPQCTCPSCGNALSGAMEFLLNPPTIRGLTESLTDLSPAEWRTILAKLRRARLLSGEDPQNPGQLDTHPLVREYFGEQLRRQRTKAWKECNKRLYDYYRALAPVSFIDIATGNSPTNELLKADSGPSVLPK